VGKPLCINSCLCWFGRTTRSLQDWLHCLISLIFSLSGPHNHQGQVLVVPADTLLDSTDLKRLEYLFSVAVYVIVLTIAFCSQLLCAVSFAKFSFDWCHLLCVSCVRRLCQAGVICCVCPVYVGYARLASESDKNHPPVRWVLPIRLDPRLLSGVFKLDWINRCRPSLLSIIIVIDIDVFVYHHCMMNSADSVSLTEYNSRLPCWCTDVFMEHLRCTWWTIADVVNICGPPVSGRWSFCGGHRCFAVAGPSTWNSLPDSLHDPTLSLDIFRHQLKTHLFAKHLWDVLCALEIFYENALYKFTLDLLTHWDILSLILLLSCCLVTSFWWRDLTQSSSWPHPLLTDDNEDVWLGCSVEYPASVI